MTKQNNTLAFVFPGQGSQQVGMLNSIALKFPLIEETFREASSALGMDLWELVQHGPENILKETMNTQPALLTAGVALWRVWQSQGGPMPALLAGHSLGEYTALVCANALSFPDGVRLVAQRGRLMQDAVPKGSGAMAAVIGLENDILQEICHSAEQDEVVAPVNFNAIGQTVIAGSTSAVERAVIQAKAKGGRVIMLPVSVPSHCELMRPAAEKLAIELANVKIGSPEISLVHNVDLQTCSHPDDIRERLVKQLYFPVRWVETIQRFVHDGIQVVIECGPGKVLSGLVKRTSPTLKPIGIETPLDLTSALETLR